MRKSVIALFLIGGIAGLNACYQELGVSLHSPGKYKGKHDDLLAKVKSPDWRQKLNDRFKMSQTDR